MRIDTWRIGFVISESLQTSVITYINIRKHLSNSSGQTRETHSRVTNFYNSITLQDILLLIVYLEQLYLDKYLNSYQMYLC